MDVRALEYLRCPSCKDESRALALVREGKPAPRQADIEAGSVHCTICGALYPIIGGVAVMSSDWPDVLRRHENFLASHISKDAAPRFVHQKFGFAANPRRDAIAAVDSDLFPYAVNHAIFSEISEDGLLEQLISSPRVRALVVESQQRGPYAYIRQKAQGLAGGLYADVGCGVGTAALLALKGGISTALGVDHSLPAVFVGRSFLRNDAVPFGACGELIVGEAAQLPLKSRSWDLVSGLNVVDEVDCAPDVLSELRRLPTASGLLVLATPFKSQGAKGNVVASARGDRFVRTHCESDIPWVVIRGPRYVEMLSIDLYEYRGAQ